MIKKKRHRQAAAIVMALAAAAFLPATHAQEKSGEALVVKRAAQLRDAPGEASRSLAPLPVQTALTRTGERQGAWIQVRMADGTAGWLHMFDVTSASTASQGGAGASALRGLTSGLTNFFGRGGSQAQSGSTVTTSTIGIRGLDAADLANAQPNMASVTQIEAMRVDAGQAQQFASGAALSTRAVEPLPVPQPASPSTGGGDSGMNSR
jgi:hypothetical protein